MSISERDQPSDGPRLDGYSWTSLQLWACDACGAAVLPAKTSDHDGFHERADPRS